MKRISLFFLVVLSGVILSGCAGGGMRNAPEHFGQPIDLTVRPEQSLGVRSTPALEEGNVTVVQAPMSDSQIGGEMYPGRISFPGWASSKENSQEAFAQYVLVGNYSSGEFMAFVIIDGKFSIMKAAKFLPLSSRTDYAWDQSGMPVAVDRIRFNDERAYRDELVEKYGISISKDSVFVEGFAKMVKSWNRYGTDHGDIYSPLSQDDIKKVAAINPGYSAVERLVLRNKTIISINPFQVVATASITVFDAMTKKSQGLDINSELPSRMQMSMIVEFIGNFRKEMIRERNVKLTKKDAEIAMLKKKLEDAVLKASVSIKEEPEQELLTKIKQPPKKIRTAERKKR
ncbi:MAG: hypothetical protein HGA36_04265 [Candidatus Moranbacteria bacterium]|nr:hypothetical protein [Candidatus Moranbacteria bacterium]